MPTLIVENVPVEVYERLKERAAGGRRSLPEEMLHVLSQLVRKAPRPEPRLPDYIPSEEISAPCDLPRSSQPVSVRAARGRPRLPDPLNEGAAE